MAQIETKQQDSFSMLLAAPQNAIFALVNEIDKRVYIGYSSILQTRLGAISSEILNGSWKYQAMVQDASKLQLQILDTHYELNFVKYFVDKYRNMGYYIYNDGERNPLQYTFGIQVRGERIAVIATKGSKSKVEILGRFDKYDEAMLFLNYINTNNKTKSLVYAI